MKKFKKGLSATNIILIIIAILFLAGLLYYAYDYLMTIIYYEKDITNFITE